MIAILFSGILLTVLSPALYLYGSFLAYLAIAATVVNYAAVIYWIDQLQKTKIDALLRELKGK